MSVSITSQPPSRAKVNKYLTRSMVVKLSPDTDTPDVNYFATASLSLGDGTYVEGLGGRITVSGSGRGGCHFPYSDLFITNQGNYSIRVDVYAMADGATLIGTVFSNYVTVTA